MGNLIITVKKRLLGYTTGLVCQTVEEDKSKVMSKIKSVLRFLHASYCTDFGQLIFMLKGTHDPCIFLIQTCDTTMCYHLWRISFQFGLGIKLSHVILIMNQYQLPIKITEFSTRAFTRNVKSDGAVGWAMYPILIKSNLHSWVGSSQGISLDPSKKWGGI